MHRFTKYVFSALLACASFAASGYGKTELLTVDLARRSSPLVWTWTADADSTVRVSVKSNGSDFDLSEWGAYLFVGDGNLAAAVPSSTPSSEQLVFDVTRQYVPTNGRYAVQIIATNLTGRVEEWARGNVTVRANPAVEAMPATWNGYVDLASRVSQLITTDLVRQEVCAATNAMVQAIIAAAGAVTFPGVTNVVTNVVTKSYVEALGISGGGDVTGKRDLTNNVCVADSFTPWDFSKLSATVASASLTLEEKGDGTWSYFLDAEYAGGGGYSEYVNESGTKSEMENRLSVSYEGGTITRTKVACSNDTFTTYAFVTNAVANASGGGSGGCDTNAVQGIIEKNVETNYLCTVAAANAKFVPLSGGLANKMTGTLYVPCIELVNGTHIAVIYPFSANKINFIGDSKNGVLELDGSYVATSNMVTRMMSGLVVTETDPTVPSWAKAASKPTYTASEVGAASAATVNQMNTSLTAVSAHLNAEDARFVSTNYDSVAKMPEAYVEIKVNGTWQTIWKEMTRWGKFVGSAFDWDTWQGFHTWSTNVTAQLATKAERCWGIYDSETGELSPDGFTQISSSNILIAANMSYKRVVDTANAVWVLESNSGLATLGGSDSYFRVKDGDGNTQFEIIKGNLRELGCDAGGITVDNSGATPVLTIPYSVVANSHPTLKICTNLADADWKAEGATGCPATVSWSGSSGAYVATVTMASASSSAFVKATYLGGSETVINNVAPTKMQYIYIGNTKYAVGYTTISGTGVMTLTPQ